MQKWEYCKVWIYYKDGDRKVQITYSSKGMRRKQYKGPRAMPMVVMRNLGEEGWKAVSQHYTLVPPGGFPPFPDIKPGVHVYVLCKRPLE